MIGDPRRTWLLRGTLFGYFGGAFGRCNLAQMFASNAAAYMQRGERAVESGLLGIFVPFVIMAVGKIFFQLHQPLLTQRLLRGMVQWLGFPAAEIPFQPDARRAGQTKYNLRRMIRLAGEGFFSFSRVPLRLSSFLGLLAIVIGLGHAGWFLLSLLTGESALAAGPTYLLVSTHLLSGSVLVAVGILGEYIGRIFEQVKDRPLYLIKEMTEHDSAGQNQTMSHRQRDAA